MAHDLEYSRLFASAVALGEDAADGHRFIDKRVLLTGEAQVLVTRNGEEIASAALKLLVRTCRNITIALPDECSALRTRLEAVACEIALTPVTFESTAAPSTFDVILSVGTRARPELPWTVINSNGWLARVSSGHIDVPADCSQTNVVGALGAACLGVADVFKRLIRLRPNKGELLDGLSFSFWSYSVSGHDPGPALPTQLPLDLLLIGCGAIGNGIAYLLAQLPISGRATILDKQTYGRENWGTCICLPADGFEGPKADFIARLLAGKIAARPKMMDVESARAEIGTRIPHHPVVLNGLDNIEARHEVQRLWPDLIIDGAIDSNFSCQVGCHPWGPDTACLICVFKQPSGMRAELSASRATGLDERVVTNGEAVVTQAHVDAAPEDKKAWLTHQIGKKICSVVSEAILNMLSSEKQRPGFEPSVPFVACFSACMVVTELVRYLTEGRTLPEPQYQLNLLWGPQRGTDFPQSRRRDCFCVERAAIIERVRSTRI